VCARASERRQATRRRGGRRPHLSDEAVRARERRIEQRADADQPAGHRELQVVVLGVERLDP
jgi:hypothetical protein